MWLDLLVVGEHPKHDNQPRSMKLVATATWLSTLYYGSGVLVNVGDWLGDVDVIFWRRGVDVDDDDDDDEGKARAPARAVSTSIGHTPSTGRSSAKRLDASVPTIIEHTDRLQVYLARATAGWEAEHCLSFRCLNRTLLGIFDQPTCQ